MGECGGKSVEVRVWRWEGMEVGECGGKSVEVGGYGGGVWRWGSVEVRVWRWEGVVREYGGGSVEVGVWR